MKNVIIFLLFLIVFGSTIKAQTFNSYEEAAENREIYHPIGIDNFRSLSLDEEIINFTGVFHGKVAGGKIRFVWLENEPVVRNKKSGEITRMWICGNKGKFFSFNAKQKELKEKNNSQQHEIGGRVDIYHHHDGEIRLKADNNIIQSSLSTKKTPKNSINDWTMGNTVSTAGCGIAGGLIGGFGFKKTEVTYTYTIETSPGAAIQSDNGTIQFGPNQTKMIEHKYSKKKFNTEGAIIGTLSGLVLGYTLNKLLF
jgi:hypothetical protein